METSGYGILNLTRAWSLCIGRPPQLAPQEIKVGKPSAIDEIEHKEWVPYTDQGMSSDKSLYQQGNIRSVYEGFARLSEIVSITAYKLYSDESPATGHMILACYTEYLRWYDNLPDHLRLGANSTPAVLFTQ